MILFTRFSQRTIAPLFMAVLFLSLSVTGRSQNPPLSDDSFTFKIYSTNYACFPFVSVYLRTFNAQHEPLVGLNTANLAVMVKGRAYDKSKVNQFGTLKTYSIETLEKRNESFRTVFVWDCSKTMEGQPFADARNAIMKFIEAKRPTDEVAILAIRDTGEYKKTGYQLVSNFEKDQTRLFQRIEDVNCDGQNTRLYDTIHHATEMCFTSSQGDINAAGAEYIVLSSIVVLSDGKDEGSAISRGELVSQINLMKIPIPIMSLAYSKLEDVYFKNLEALSRATFGSYWTMNETQQFASTIQRLHMINRGDYVVTFRVYDIAVDGEKHNYKLALSYPSGSGKLRIDEGTFDAVDLSPLVATTKGAEILNQLNLRFPVLQEGPYMVNPAAAPREAAPVAQNPANPAAPK